MFRRITLCRFWIYIAIMAPFALFACFVAFAVVFPLVVLYEKMRRG